QSRARSVAQSADGPRQQRDARRDRLRGEPMFRDVVTTETDLRALLGSPSEVALKKQITRLDEHCRAFIAHAPFMLLATSDAAGRCDVSPKGDPAGFVCVLDDTHLVIPDRPATNGSTACGTSWPIRTSGCCSSCRPVARRC